MHSVLSIPFTEPSLFYVLLSVLDWFGTWCYRTTLSRCHPARYCDSLEEFVVDDGIKTLDLHLRATCRGRSAAHFDSIDFRPSYYCVYRQSYPYKIIYYLCSSKPIELEVGLLFEYVLIGCTVTESKIFTVKVIFGIPYNTKEAHFKSLVSGVDTIKACT